MSGGARDRYHQTRAQAFGALKRHRQVQLDLQGDFENGIVRAAQARKAITPQNVEALRAGDVDAWQSILFPGGQ